MSIPERSYTVTEINNLRRTVRNKCLYGSYSPRGPATSIAYRETDLNTIIEEQVRTHMLAGHTADDLINLIGSENK